MSTDDTTQPPQAQVWLLVNQHGLISGVRFTKQTPDVVFGDPEVVRIKPCGEVVIAEGANLDDAALAFWHAITEWRSTASRPTLADAQPGGRVRLGDAPWPEIDAILADAYSAGAEGLPFEGIARRAAVRKAIAAVATNNPSPQEPVAYQARKVIGDVIGHWHAISEVEYKHFNEFPTRTYEVRALYAALSAHPSPGGQGEVTDDMVKAALGLTGWSTYNEEWSGRDRMRAALQAALAARQPVGEPVAWLLISEAGTTIGATRHARERDSWEAAGGTTGPLYAAPHAQAVDLADFKALYRAYVRLLESGRDRIRDLGGTCDPVDVMEANDVDLQAARRVLDSQAEVSRD